MKWTLPLLFLLPAVLLQASVAASVDQFGSAVGVGEFSGLARDATAVFHPGPDSSWALGGRAELLLVDDNFDLQVAHPLNPGENLFSRHNRTVTRHFLGPNVTLSQGPDDGHDAIVLVESASLGYRFSGALELRPVQDVVLERSHVPSSSQTGGAPTDYEIARHEVLDVVGNGPAQVNITGRSTIYVWGTRISTPDASFVTGRYDEVVAGTRTTHVVHGWLTVEAAHATLADERCRLLSPDVTLEATGLLQLANATLAGAGSLGADLINAPAGQYALSAAGTRVSLDQAPESLVAAQMEPRGWSGALVGLVLGCTVIAAFLAYWIRPRRVRADRWARWARISEDHGLAWLAARFSRRVVVLYPASPEVRLEHAIRLRAANRLHAALTEHGRVQHLADPIGDRDLLARNGYEAAVALAQSGDTTRSFVWLQSALELDPLLGLRAASDPRLHGLRLHPDYRALVGVGNGR